MSHERQAPGSLTRLIPKVKEGDHLAYDQLVERVLSRVVGIAGRLYKRKYPGLPRSAADEEDAVQDALLSLWRAQRGMFEQLANRNDLWSLLATITARKIAKQCRAERTKKRGGRNLRLPTDADVDVAVDRIPAPDLAAMFKDTYNRAMSCLSKEHTRVARDWSEGRSRHETAQAMKVTITTVSRMRREIAETVRRQFPEDE